MRRNPSIFTGFVLTGLLAPSLMPSDARAQTVQTVDTVPHAHSMNTITNPSAGDLRNVPDPVRADGRDADPWRPRGFHAGATLGYSRLSLMLQASGAGGEFVPRTAARPGFDVRYGPFGVAFTLPEDAGSWPQPSSGGLQDMRAHYHGRTFGVEAHHRAMDGFSVYDGARGRFSEYSDMRLQSTGATLYFTVDPEARAYRLAEGRAMPGGGVDVFLTLAASHAGLRTDEPLVRKNGSRFDGLQRMDAVTAAFGAGYAITSNLHGLYIDQALFAGYGPQWTSVDGRDELNLNIVKFNLRARIGVRSRYFDVGAGFENDAHAVVVGRERATFHTLVARAQAELFL